MFLAQLSTTSVTREVDVADRQNNRVDDKVCKCKQTMPSHVQGLHQGLHLILM